MLRETALSSVRRSIMQHLALNFVSSKRKQDTERQNDHTVTLTSLKIKGWPLLHCRFLCNHFFIHLSTSYIILFHFPFWFPPASLPFSCASSLPSLSSCYVFGSDIAKLIPTHRCISSISCFCFVKQQLNQCLLFPTHGLGKGWQLPSLLVRGWGMQKLTDSILQLSVCTCECV